MEDKWCQDYKTMEKFLQIPELSNRIIFGCREGLIFLACFAVI